MFKYGSNRCKVWSFQIVTDLPNKKKMGIVCCRHSDGITLTRIVSVGNNKPLVKETIEKFEDYEQENPIPIHFDNVEFLEDGSFKIGELICGTTQNL